MFSCADVPGTPDQVLTPSDMATLNGMLAQIDNHIRQQATARGYAYFSLGVLYERSDLKSATYSVISQLTSQIPYGPFISLDGTHPSAFGHVIIAAAAASAINKTYGGFGVHAATPALPSLRDQMAEETLPSVALDLAKRFAKAHQGEQVSLCPMPGGVDAAAARH